jgi:hypothetical protein
VGGVLHGLLVALVIALVALTPCAVCVLLINADHVLARGGDFLRGTLPRRVRVWVEERELRRERRRAGLDGRWSAGPDGRRWRLEQLDRVREQRIHGGGWVGVPPIEQVALDLRRLNRLRESVARRSRLWFVAVSEAYDDGLRIACAQLGVEEFLGELSGVDLELERVRVEGELQGAGLVLRDAGASQR